MLQAVGIQALRVHICTDARAARAGEGRRMHAALRLSCEKMHVTLNESMKWVAKWVRWW